MKAITCLMALLGLVASGVGEMRTWTAQAGQTIEAEYIRDSMGQVWLKVAGGKQKKVPIEALSKEGIESQVIGFVAGGEEIQF